VAAGAIRFAQPDEAEAVRAVARDVEIANIAVVAAEQGKGYGGRLLALAEEESRRRGCDVVRLDVYALVTENIDIYRRLGYSEVERFRRGGLDRQYLCMTKHVR
jgi:ribosomal protein S18 acetylase RimI-like enzyme